ncbi:TPM domain-containing protein [Candidatus Gracilibacteria bacterium]|nr:TPM domain-containing protein [Candidatus Gracilibacteria bacterium]
MIPKTINKKFTRFIEDNSKVLPENTAFDLNQKFADLERKNTMQVVVLLFPHREGESLYNIGLELFNSNGIGQKGKNNGLLLLISTEEKKIRIMVGKGLEWIYTTEVCKNIIENELRPLLNQGKFEELVGKFYEIVSQEELELQKYKNIKDIEFYNPYLGNSIFNKGNQTVPEYIILLITTIFLGRVISIYAFLWLTISAFFYTYGIRKFEKHRKEEASVFIRIIVFIITVISSFFITFGFYPWFVFAFFFTVCFFLLLCWGEKSVYYQMIFDFLYMHEYFCLNKSFSMGA